MTIRSHASSSTFRMKPPRTARTKRGTRRLSSSTLNATREDAIRRTHPHTAWFHARRGRGSFDPFRRGQYNQSIILFTHTHWSNAYTLDRVGSGRGRVPAGNAFTASRDPRFGVGGPAAQLVRSLKSHTPTMSPRKNACFPSRAPQTRTRRRVEDEDACSRRDFADARPSLVGLVAFFL